MKASGLVAIIVLILILVGALVWFANSTYSSGPQVPTTNYPSASTALPQIGGSNGAGAAPTTTAQ